LEHAYDGVDYAGEGGRILRLSRLERVDHEPRFGHLGLQSRLQNISHVDRRDCLQMLLRGWGGYAVAMANDVLQQELECVGEWVGVLHDFLC
jgi:hypothetical protein